MRLGRGERNQGEEKVDPSALAVRIDHPDIAAVRSGGEHSRAEAAQACGAPAMEEDESRAVGVEEQMIEIVLSVPGIARDVAEFGDIGQGYYQFPAARVEIDPKNARILGSRVVGVRVGQAGVSVTGPHILDPAKIRRNSGATVGADGIYRIGQSLLGAGVDIEYMAYKTTVPSVIP